MRRALEATNAERERREKLLENARLTNDAGLTGAGA